MKGASANCLRGLLRALPLETLRKLRGLIEFRDKEVLLKEIYPARAERRL